MEPLKSILLSCVNPKFVTLWAALCKYSYKGILHTSEVYFKKAKINHSAMYDNCTSQLHHFFFFLFALKMVVLMSAPALGGGVEGFVHGRMGMVA